MFSFQLVCLHFEGFFFVVAIVFFQSFFFEKRKMDFFQRGLVWFSVNGVLFIVIKEFFCSFFPQNGCFFPNGFVSFSAWFFLFAKRFFRRVD